VLSPGETMTPENGMVALKRVQHMIDAWQADRLTLAVQARTTFTLLSGTSTVSIGPSGATVTMPRPVWIDTVNYVIPGSSPGVEVIIAQMGRDQFANLSIKAMQSALPTQCFYQTSNTTTAGSLYFWPQVTQNVTIVLYTPQGIGVPATLDDILTGPPGYQDAFMYQLALRLVTPMGVDISSLPLLPKAAQDAWQVIKRVNTMPGLLGMDPALSPAIAGGYNVLSDNTTSPSNR
jgi:hypothetical protein